MEIIVAILKAWVRECRLSWLVQISEMRSLFSLCITLTSVFRLFSTLATKLMPALPYPLLTRVGTRNNFREKVREMRAHCPIWSPVSLVSHYTFELCQVAERCIGVFSPLERKSWFSPSLTVSFHMKTVPTAQYVSLKVLKWSDLWNSQHVKKNSFRRRQ